MRGYPKRNIFVSSTFKDMQAERDIIRQKVFPAINKVANFHNDHIEFSDLRWGIDTLNQSEQEASIKIMKACLNELHRSDNLMVILLGDRYGWIPDEEQISATAFEIEKGVFGGGKDAKDALVYFRKLENIGESEIPEFYFEQNSENKIRLEELKERLSNCPNCEVHWYTASYKDGSILQDDLDAFAKRLKEDLERKLADKWVLFDQLSDFDRELDIQEKYINTKAEEFCARKEEAEQLEKKIREWLEEWDNKKRENLSKNYVHFIVGPSGSGKSTLISEIARRLTKEKWDDKYWDVLPFVGGLIPECGDAISVLRKIIYYIEEQLDIQHQESFGEKITPALIKQKLQERLVDVAGQYVQSHRPLIVLIDALEQLYPDENRDELVFCPQGLNGNIWFFITCTEDFKTGAADKTVLKNLKREDRELTINAILRHRHKEISEDVISELLKHKGVENPFYISMVIDRLMLMDQNDFRIINEQGGQIEDIVSYQKDIITSLPDQLSEMAVYLYDKVGEKIGQDFTQKALQYIAISRRGLRESDLAYCMGKEWDPIVFSDLLYYLDNQFLTHNDGRIDFTHKALRQGVVSRIKNKDSLHLKLEWCYHEKDIMDSVRATEILYHCYHKKDYRYAAGVLRPIVYQDYSQDEDIRDITSRMYAQTIVELAMPDRAEWIREWLCHLLEDAQKNKESAQKNEKGKWDSLWTTIWFLSNYVLHELPNTQAGNETGASIVKYIDDVLYDAEIGTWSEKDYQSVRDKLKSHKAYYMSMAGDLWVAQIEYKEKFKKSKTDYEQLAEKNYDSWRNMFEDSYHWLCVMKSSSDENVLRIALEPAAYGISLLSEKFFADKYINEEGCVIGKLYGCIGELCQRLNNFEANLIAYEQDLRYREEIYNRNGSIDALLSYSGSYHNISQIYLNFKNIGEKDLKNVYSHRLVFFEDSNYPLKLLPLKSFSSGIEKTEGEVFMDHCHEEPLSIASLLSKNREIELLEIALKMNSDSKWFDENNSSSSKGFWNTIWHKYFSCSEIYFDALHNLDSFDEKQAILFSRKNIQVALQRLCKSLEYCWESFFDEPEVSNALNVARVGEYIYCVRNYINIDDKSEVFGIFDLCIHGAEELMKDCLVRDTFGDVNIVQNIQSGTECVRWILLNSCLMYAQIVRKTYYLEEFKDMVFNWYNIGSKYVSETKMWINTTTKKIHIKKKHNNETTKLKEDAEFNKNISTWKNDFKEILYSLM